MQRVLFAIHLDSFFTGLFGIASRFARTGEYAPQVYFAQSYPGLARDVERCRAQQVEVLFGAGSPARPAAAAAAEHAPEPAARTSALDGVRSALLAQVPLEAKKAIARSLPYEALRLTQRVQQVRRLIREHGISLLVLGGDVVHYDTAAFIKAAHLEGIRALLVAGWMIHQDENAEAFRFDPAISLHSWPNRVAAALYPRWAYHYKGETLLRLPAGRALAREWLGMAPEQPWTLHSGHADAIALESEASRQACLQEGLPANKLHVTGSINHDTMTSYLRDASRLRAELCAELGLQNPERPLIVCSLPPDEFYRQGGRPECSFRDHAGVAEAIAGEMAAVRERGWNAVLCLHPSLVHEQMKPLERFGAPISRRHTAELVALCDLYVASNSTTIQWASTCGKPIINYDVYRYRQNDYASVGGMITMEEQSEFAAVLRRITSDPAYHHQLAAAQDAIKETWGRLDGHAGDRIAELCRSLIAERRAGAA